MAEAGTLHDAFINELRDTYDAEQQLTRALSTLAGAARSADLRTAFEEHLEETRGHLERLEAIYEACSNVRSTRPAVMNVQAHASGPLSSGDILAPATKSSTFHV